MTGNARLQMLSSFGDQLNMTSIYGHNLKVSEYSIHGRSIISMKLVYVGPEIWQQPREHHLQCTHVIHLA